MTINGMNVQVLTFYPLFAEKNHFFLDVRLRWFNDKNPSSTPDKQIFLGESELRVCQGVRTGFRAGIWSGRSCVQEAIVVEEAVVVGDSSDETYDVKERIDKLPHLISGENYGLGAYFKLETTSNLQITSKNCHNTSDKYTTNATQFCHLLSDELRQGYASFLRAHYYFQPENSRIKNYSPNEVGQCFMARGLKRTLIIGDSQTQRYYNSLGNFYGGGNHDGSDKLSIKYIPNWDNDYTRLDAMFKDTDLFRVGGPEVFLFNSGFSHNDLDFELFLKWWLDKMKDPMNVIPKVRIFIGVVSVQGLRRPGWSLRHIRERNERYSVLTKLAGFAWFDPNALTVPMPVESSTEEDGFHYIDDVTNLAAMVMINMICNAAVESLKGNGAEKWYGIGDKLEVKQEHIIYHDVTYEKIVIRGEEVNSPVFVFKNDTAREMSWKSGYNVIDYQKWKLFGDEVKKS